MVAVLLMLQNHISEMVESVENDLFELGSHMGVWLGCVVRGATESPSVSGFYLSPRCLTVGWGEEALVVPLRL